jgi:hypothetical protein
LSVCVGNYQPRQSLITVLQMLCELIDYLSFANAVQLSPARRERTSSFQSGIFDPSNSANGFGHRCHP